MSYDILLLSREPGQSWNEILDANERRILGPGDRPLSLAARTRLERIAGHLLADDPQLERFATERHIELSRVDNTGIQVSLFSSEMAVALSYWHTGPAARAVMQIVWAYLAILEQETGWEAYDRQLDRSLDLARDLDEVVGCYADLSVRLHRRFPKALRAPDQSVGSTAARHSNRAVRKALR